MKESCVAVCHDINNALKALNILTLRDITHGFFCVIVRNKTSDDISDIPRDNCLCNISMRS